MPDAPSGLEAFILAASFVLTAMLAVMIWWATGRAGLPSASRTRAWLVAMAILVGWQLIGLALARAGVFVATPDRLGSGIGIAIVLPVLLGLAGIATSPTARRIVEATPLSALVAIQVYRVVGAVFLVLLAAGHLPGAFALPAGLGDVLIGLAAPIIGYAVARRPAMTRFVGWWNTLGILDLVVAVATGFLSSPGMGQLLALEAPNRLITAYPLVLVPLYAVPISLILHGLVLHKLASSVPSPNCRPPCGTL